MSNQGTKWKWRKDEIQLAEFVKLTSTAKQEHIHYLLSLPKKELGTNDHFILRLYAPEQQNKINKFLNINENELQ